MTPDATLASIDGALRDWGTSGDAMRWQPDPGRVICDEGRPLWPYNLDSWRAYAPAPGELLGAVYGDDGRPLPLTRRPSCRSSLVPLEHAIAIEVCKLFGVPLIIGSHSHPRPVRCRACNPAGNPRPLAIDGAAYRTRQRARRRR